MRTLGWLNKLVRNERGNVLVIVAAAMPLVIGAAAIGVDTVQVSLAKRQLQRSADSAALAGVYALVQTQNVNTAVNHDLALNNDVTLSGSPVIQNAPTVGSYAGNPNAVRVVLTAQRTVPFMRFFTGTTMTVTAEATAARVYQGQYCAIALEDTNTTGISIGGSATVNLGCGMISNSTSPTSVTAGGSSSITASPVAGVGGVPSSGNYASGTVLLPYSPEQADPYAALPTPVVPSGCSNQALRVQPTETLTVGTSTPGYVSPGVYCWKGLDIKGTVTFPANSIIYVDGSSLDFGAQANVTGSGVTFILTSATAASNANSIAQVSINGGATLNLTAPDSGTYSGVLMYQDRRANYGTSHINGNSSTTFRGGFYFPNRELVFNGTSGMQTTCVQFVGRRLSFSGNASIQNTCPSGSGSQAFDATRVRLVG